MRWPLPMLVLSLAACGDARTRPVDEEVRISPDTLDFGQVFVGGHRALALEVSVLRSGEAQLTGQATRPFEVPSEPRPGTLEVTFRPSEPGTVRSELRLTVSGRELNVPLIGEGLPALPCEASSTCAAAHFDPQLGACVETPARDGEPCANHCLNDAVCANGVCVGTSVDCDDGDACTLDACAPDAGCISVPRSCTSDDPCQAGVCVPGTGCAFTQAPDETDCGGGRICDAGQCVWKRPHPRTLCAQSTPCAGPGVWSTGTCIRPQATPLVPAWHWKDGRVSSAVAVDAAGNLYWREMDDEAWTSELISVTPAGALRFRKPLGRPRAGSPLVRGDRVFMLEYDLSGDYVTARSTTTGELKWKRDLVAELGISQTRGMHGSLVLAPGDALRLIASDDPNEAPQHLVTLDERTGAVRRSVEIDAQVSLWGVDEDGRSLLTTWTGNSGARKEVRDPLGTLLWSLGDPDWGADPFRYGMSVTEDGRVQSSLDGAQLAQLPVDGAEARLYRNPRFVVSGGAIVLGRELPPGGTWVRWSYPPTHVFLQPLPTGGLQVHAPDDGQPFQSTSKIHLTSRGGLLYASDDGMGGFRLRETRVTGELLYECALPWIPTSSCCGSHFFGDWQLLLDGRWIVTAGTGGVYVFDLPGVSPDPTATP